VVSSVNNADADDGDRDGDAGAGVTRHRGADARDSVHTDRTRPARQSCPRPTELAHVTSGVTARGDAWRARRPVTSLYPAGA
jgi:hypothetical protein